MSKNEKTKVAELDITGLLSLKTYERPDEIRVEKNIQNIMREVRAADRMPSLLLFPDKSFAWMFAQPRYGVAALFILFLGLHLLERPLPVASAGTAMLKAPGAAEAVAAAGTNQIKAVAVPGLAPAAYSAFADGSKPTFAAFSD
ncbi:MAG: hypothetical protein WC334_06950 [Kiritimatiellales bacterium]